MTKEEHEAFLREAGQRAARRRRLRLVLNAMNLTALASMLVQMGEAELSDVETLVEAER